MARRENQSAAEAATAQQFVRRARVRDIAIIGALTATIFAIHAPFLRVPILDVDEAEFMASAAYLYYTGQSVFTCPNHTYTIGVYRLAIDLSQPYDLLPLRLLNIPLIAAVTGLVYWWVARATSRWIGCLVAAHLIVLSMYHNGFLVNREWPCVLALLAGAYLFLRAQEMTRAQQNRMIFAAGLTTGLGLFFKEQAAYITQAAPIWLLIQIVADRSWQPWLRQGLFYAAGGLSAGLLYIAPFVWQGTLRSHLYAELTFGTMYAYASLAPDEAWHTNNWICHFLTFRRASILIIVAYMAVLSVTPSLFARFRGQSNDPIRGNHQHVDINCQALLLIGCYLVTSMFSVAMGNRFFSGYFLLWLPFVCVAAGYGIQWIFCNSTRASRAVLWIPLVYSVLAMNEHLIQLLTLFVFIGLTGLAWRCGAITKKGEWSWVPRVGLMTVLLVTLILDAELMEVAPRTNAAEAELVLPTVATRTFFREHARPDDRLFVWGAEPSFYCVTRLQPSSRSVACGGAAFTGDYFNPSGISATWADSTIAELRLRPPRFIVVQATRGDRHVMSEQMYALDRFPELRALVQESYLPFAYLPDCDVFERR